MKLTTKANRIQQNIANALRKGLPLAGLLSSLIVITSCDLFKKSSDDTPTAGYISEPKTAEVITQKQSEEPAPQPSTDRQPKLPIVQGNNVSEPQSNESPWVTTCDPKLPIVHDINRDFLLIDFNNLIEENIRSTKDYNDDIENSIRASKINPK